MAGLGQFGQLAWSPNCVQEGGISAREWKGRKIIQAGRKLMLDYSPPYIYFLLIEGSQDLRCRCAGRATMGGRRRAHIGPLWPSGKQLSEKDHAAVLCKLVAESWGAMLGGRHTETAAV